LVIDFIEGVFACGRMCWISFTLYKVIEAEF
jgi:hypothetical protein